MIWYIGTWAFGEHKAIEKLCRCLAKMWVLIGYLRFTNVCFAYMVVMMVWWKRIRFLKSLVSFFFKSKSRLIILVVDWVIEKTLLVDSDWLNETNGFGLRLAGAGCYIWWLIDGWMLLAGNWLNETNRDLLCCYCW